jgi:hypothetical protein
MKIFLVILSYWTELLYINKNVPLLAGRSLKNRMMNNLEL